ncbi:MAG: adenylate kinase [Planctomycetota bacterium]
MTRHYLIFGPPAAGKGTQAHSLKEHLRVPHVSTGDMFRANIREETPLGLEVKELLASGTLVPDSLTNRLVADRLAQDDVADGVLLDGFPRNVPQAAWLDGYLAGRGTQLAGVVVLEVPDDELVERLKGRAEKEGRADDADVNVIRKRINTYKEQSEPCIQYYEEQGLVPVHHVDGVGSIEEVAERIRAAV